MSKFNFCGNGTACSRRVSDLNLHKGKKSMCVHVPTLVASQLNPSKFEVQLHDDPIKYFGIFNSLVNIPGSICAMTQR